MRGRTTFLVIVLAGGCLLAGLLATYGYDATWRLWNIPTMQPRFADVRTITGGAESARLGYDPMVENPADPWGRTMDYPHVWKLLFVLGIDQGDTALIALIMIAAFTAGLFLFVRDFDRKTAVVLAAAVFSPAVLLGVERGNNDLLIFFLMALALAALRRSAALATGLITLGAALMYFPVFGLAVLLGQPRRRCLLLAGAALAVTAAYVLATVRDVRLIGIGALRGTTISYGFNVLHTSVRDYFGSRASGLWLEYACLAVFLVMFAVAVRTRGRHAAVAGPAARQHLDAFRLGAAVYIGTFLLGNNWDYRLMFLLFTIPQLMDWRRGDARLALVARATLVAVLASLWLQFLFRFAHLAPYGGHLVFALDEAANWAVLGGMMYLVSHTVPEWCLRRVAPAPS